MSRKYAFVKDDVRDAIIEECAKVCDKHAEWAESKITKNPSSSSSQLLATISNAANDCAAEIRELKALAVSRPKHSSK